MSTRRNFLRVASLFGASTALSSFSSLDIPTSSLDSRKSFTYKNGKFKILQITDTHYIYGDERSSRALENVRKLLELEQPDLVIHTGDIIFGPPAFEGLKAVLKPFEEKGVPFAVALGNHDQEQGPSRQEIYDFVRSLPMNINSPSPEIDGASNDLILLRSAGGKIERALYLLDSHQVSELEEAPGYGYIHTSQINWYKELSTEVTKANQDKPVESYAFFHIPLQEYNWALRLAKDRKLRGNFGEEPCSSGVNSGFFLAAKECGDIKAIFNGHDHDNDCALYWNKMFMIYGRFSGCDTVYNNLRPNGGRLIELTEGEKGFRSWVRLSDGSVEQDLSYPKDWEDAK